MIGIPGVTRARDVVIGPTEPLGASGGVPAPKASAQRCGGTGARRCRSRRRAHRPGSPGRQANRWPSLSTITSRPGPGVRSRMRNASARAAGRSLDPREAATPSSAASIRPRSEARRVDQGPDPVARDQDGDRVARPQSATNPRAQRRARASGRRPADLAPHAGRAVEHQHHVAPAPASPGRVGTGGGARGGPERPGQGQRDQREQGHAGEHQEPLGQPGPPPLPRAELEELHRPPVDHLVMSAAPEMDDQRDDHAEQPGEHRGVEHPPGHAPPPRRALPRDRDAR